MSNSPCEYCQEGNRKWLNSGDNRMRFKLVSKKDSGSPYKKLRLRVHWNSWKLIREMDTKRSSTFSINYCPMCARDLNKSKF